MMPHDVLDLGGEVERQLRELVVHPADDSHRMAGSVQKIGIAKSYVTRSGTHLIANLGHHRLERCYEKASVINRRDRAVRAPVQASSTRFDVPREPFLTVDDKSCVPVKRRKGSAIRQSSGEPP